MLRTETFLTVEKSHIVMYRKKPFRAQALRLWIKVRNHIKLAASKDIFCNAPNPTYLN